MKNIIFLMIIITVTFSCSSNKRHHKKHHAADNTRYTREDLNVRLWQERFENRDRDVYLQKDSIVNALKISPNDRIVDVGAGTGFFLKQFSEKVGVLGKVYAVDISPGFIKFLHERKELESIENLVVVKGKEESTTLKAKSVNKVFVCDTFHHFGNPKNMLNDFKTVLKPGGELFVVDFNRVVGQSRKWIIDHIHMSKADYIKQIESFGFKFEEDIKTSLKENFMLKFTVR
jgi:ubiquinone/menaquinone biosynthesis C-methylase UbiE